MNDLSAPQPRQALPLPQDLHLLQEPGFARPNDPKRPNRLCICLSDLHFTDGTVGNQSADAVVWENVFESIMDICVNEEAEELHLILAGDVVDMIRTARWAEAGIYPWYRERPEYESDPAFRAKFDGILASIMDGIVGHHALEPAPGQRPGFFYLLRQLPEMLKGYEYKNSVSGIRKSSKVKRVRTLALLGNHDKEILVCGAVLKTFYEKCLGQPLDPASPNCVSADYRRWIGKMYFGKEDHFPVAPDAAPWTPFYWCDQGFRLFVTHGHWRDPENNRSIRGETADTRWQNADGWNLKRWQDIEFAPFTRPCWGDTIVASMLAGFMYRGKQRLDGVEQKLKAGGNWGTEDERLFNTLRRVLDEMDLYRPNAAATLRLMQLTRQLRNKGSGASLARDAIEKELFDSLHAWANQEFTLTSASSAKVRWIVRIGKFILNILNFFNRPFFNRSSRAGFIDLGFAYCLISCINDYQQTQRDDPTLEEMRTFTAFLDTYRSYGFRLHCEGHTHIALQEDLYFHEPAIPESDKNYTYINFGTWRDQVKPTQNAKYRRFSIGRALVVLDKTGETQQTGGEPNRRFAYYVQDLTSWSDKADAWDAAPAAPAPGRAANPELS